MNFASVNDIANRNSIDKQSLNINIPNRNSQKNDSKYKLQNNKTTTDISPNQQSFKIEENFDLE